MISLTTAACVPMTGTVRTVASTSDAGECKSASSVSCFFRNGPVQLTDSPTELPGRPYTFFPTARALDFVDGRRRDWQAPQGTLTDGASIPQLFVPIVGAPRTQEFVNAAAMHDAYCGIGNEAGARYHADTWQNVHAMFYDSLIAGGTPEVKAKVMFAAVWLGGPRWYPISGATDNRMAAVPAAAMRAAMMRARNHIQANNPSIAALQMFLRAQEAGLLNGARAGNRDEEGRRGQLPGDDTGRGDEGIDVISPPSDPTDPTDPTLPGQN